MLIRRFLLWSVGALVSAGSPAYAEKLKCKIQLDDGIAAPASAAATPDDAARMVFEIDHDNTKAQIKVGTLSSPMRPKFKDVPVSDQDDQIVFDATPAHALDSEKAGCSTRQYYYHLRLGREGDRLRGELAVTPFYKRAAGARTRCQGFAAPEIVTEYHRGVLCLVSGN